MEIGYAQDNAERIKRLILGKVTVRYTRTKVFTGCGDDIEVEPYKVVAKDSDSVAVVVDDNIIYHLNFEDNYYWICQGKWRDYFKKIE